MSKWTHVNGAIRFDCLRGAIPGHNRQGIEKILGSTCDFGDPDHVWKACTVPKGSEGSIQFAIHENPNKDAISAFMVQIWGDLRNYEDYEEIKEWFYGIPNRAKESSICIRSAVLEIDIEYGLTYLLSIMTDTEGEAEYLEFTDPGIKK